MPLGDIYTTGTASIAAAATLVSGTGVIWSDVVQGDEFRIGSVAVPILSVDPGLDELTLQAPWPGTTQTDQPYMIEKRSTLRLAHTLEFSDKVRKFVTDVTRAGIFLHVGDGLTPDPELGEEDQFAFRAAPLPWTVWQKQSGVWVEIGTPAGQSAGLAYEWSTDTAATDPGAGALKINNAAFAPATALYISETDGDGRAVGPLLATWDDGTSTIKGRIVIYDPADATKFAEYDVTGALTDNGAWDTFTIVHRASGASFTNGLPLNVLCVPKGDKGDAGATGATGAAGPGYAATSATSLAIGSGSKTFAIGTGHAYSIGARARASSAADGANYMEGLVTAYSGGNLTINVSATGGAGTFADWNINLAGNPGIGGDLSSANNLSELTATHYTARKNIKAAGIEALKASLLSINGSMDISQENGTTAIDLASGTEKYIIDQWTMRFVRAATLAISGQKVGVPAALSGIVNALQMKATTGLTTLAAGDYAYMSQPIEGRRTRLLKWGTADAEYATIGFFVYASIAGTMTVIVTNSASNRSYAVNVAINAAATWELKLVQIPGDTGGSWQVNTSLGVRAILSFGCGATNQGAAGAWLGTLALGTSATANFMVTTNNVAVVTGFGLVPGRHDLTAADWVKLMRDEDAELELCYRYYHQWSSINGTCSYAVGTTAYVVPGGENKPLMRVTPAGIANVGGTSVAGRRDGAVNYTFSGISIFTDGQLWSNMVLTGLSPSPLVFNDLYFVKFVALSARM